MDATSTAAAATPWRPLAQASDPSALPEAAGAPTSNEPTIAGTVPTTHIPDDTLQADERLRAEAALRESEKKYRDLVETSHDLIWSVDAEGRWTFLNGNGTRAIYGCEPEEMLGRSFQEIVPPGRSGDCMAIFESIKQGTPLIRYETENLRKDGSVVVLSFNAIALTDAEGNVVGATGTAQDVTDRWRSRQALAHKQAELLHSSRLNTVETMAAAISHEIAQPLSALSNFASACSRLLAGDGPLDRQAVRAYVDEIVRQSLRAGSIMQWLRDFSRKSPPRREKCDLVAVVRDAVELTADEFRRREIQVDWNVADGACILSADPVQLQQLLVNLLNNAADAVGDVEPARRTVTVRCGRRGDQAVLAVEDRGTGIPLEMVDRLFQPFATSKPHGMGMGLSICRAIAAEHGGEIEARSNPEGGAVFEVCLPL